MKTDIFKELKPFIIKHSPELLTALGLSGLVFSIFSTAKATVKSVNVLNDEKIIPTPKAAFKRCWKYYIPAAASVAISVPCIIFGNRISTKRNAALAAAYTLSETALKEYQDKTLEVVGPQREQKIHEALSADEVKKTYTGNNVILTGDGDSLFFEPLSGRYFKSSWNKIQKAANDLNAIAIGSICGYVTLTEWYDMLGLDRTDVSEEFGWSIEGGKEGLLDICIDSTLTPDNVPCGSIYYKTKPKFIK